MRGARVRFHGVRGSTPCAGPRYDRFGGNTACVSLEAEGHAPVIFDMGTGLRPYGEQLVGFPTSGPEGPEDPCDHPGVIDEFRHGGRWLERHLQGLAAIRKLDHPRPRVGHTSPAGLGRHSSASLAPWL